MKRLMTILLLIIFFLGGRNTAVLAQKESKDVSPVVTGQVVDTGGEPIIGASVKWDGSKTGTITNVDGRFMLPRPAGSNVLVISYIGYKQQQINVSSMKGALVVKLEDDAQLMDEMVVVGYGLQKKSNLTGSVEVIKAEDLLMIPATNLDQALQGQVAGLQVMQSTGDPSTAKETSIRIRGITDSPLLVIDGVPRFGTTTSDGETRLSDLNPDDIESISILKDAAAAAVYGSRAANGVILVQTKKANADKKLRINYRGQFNLTEATQLPEFLDAYNFALLRNKAIENSPSTTLEPYTEEQLEQIRTGSNPNVYGNENIIDYLDKTGYTTTHSVSASGGNNKVGYYMSLGYSKSKGLYSGVGRDRLNYVLKLDAELAKGLNLSVSYNGSNSEANNSSYTTIDAAYSYSPVQVLKFENGDLASIDGSNPLISIYGLGGYIKDTSHIESINARLTWQVPWIKGLSVYASANFDDNHRIEKDFSEPYTLYTYSEATGEYSADENTIYPKATASLEETDRFYSSQLYEAGLNYNNVFAEKHDVGVTFVANYQRSHNQYMIGENQSMSSYPQTIGTAQTARLVGDESVLQRASLIGRLSYSYAQRYFGEFSFRVDGSTNFAPSKRWGFFPSVSASWVISNEPFFKNLNQRVVSNVKLRLSTGWLGNDGMVEAYSYLKMYKESTNYGYSIGGNFTPGLMLSTNPNEELTWGKTHDYNAGLDLGFWGGRIAVTAEYYLRYETNKITAAPDYMYPPSTGVDGNVPNMNFAKLKAWGWDLTLAHKNTIGKLRYNASLTLSRSDDKYVDYGDESSQLPNLRRVGNSSMVWSMYEADGLFRSQEEIDNWPVDQDGQGNATLAPGDIKYKDQDGDNVLTASDKIYVKNSSYPDLDLAVRVGASYKGFFVNLLFQGEMGYKQNITESYTLENGTMQKFQSYHLTDTWSEDNPTASYPRLKIATSNDNNRKASTFWIKDCDFIRLKTVNAGYQFPSQTVKKLHLQNLSIALQASNVFTWTTLDDMDPESLRGYPVQRSYGVTLNIGI